MYHRRRPKLLGFGCGRGALPERLTIAPGLPLSVEMTALWLLIAAIASG
jgi:hypothetical protein